MSIEDVEGHVGRGDFPAALRRALTDWRMRRDPALAELIDALSARAAARPFAPRNEKAEVFQGAWLAAVRENDPALLAFALETLSRGVPQVVEAWAADPGAPGRRYAAWLERLRVVVQLEDDPRMSAACIDVLERQPFTALWSNELYQPLLMLLERVGDVRVIDRLRHLARHCASPSAFVRDYLAERFPPIADRIAARPRVALEGDELRRVRDLTDALRGPQPARRTFDVRDEQKLIAQVASDVDDPAPRRVLADLWVERGDPRGELMALQFDRPDDPRVRSLIHQHEAKWLGALKRVSLHRVWVHGFLDALTLRVNHAAPEPIWKDAANDAALATVRSIEQGQGNVRHYFALTLAAGNLRAVSMKTRLMLDTFGARERPRLAEVRLEFALDRRAVDRLARLTDLKRVTVATANPDRQRAFAEELRRRGVTVTFEP